MSLTAYLSTGDMETYAENTFSSVLYLTLEGAGRLVLVKGRHSHKLRYLMTTPPSALLRSEEYRC